MKKILFLFMFLNASFVFAGETIYLPNELTLCSSCVIKLPQHLTKSGYCSKEKNKETIFCGGKDDYNYDLLYKEIRNLDSFSDCKIKTYNSILDKFRKRYVKIIEEEDPSSSGDDESSGYNSDDTYKYTMCLTALSGKFYVLKDSKIEKVEIPKIEVKKTDVKTSVKIETKVGEIKKVENTDNENEDGEIDEE